MSQQVKEYLVVKNKGKGAEHSHLVIPVNALKVLEGVWGNARVSRAKPCRSNGTLRCSSPRSFPTKTTPTKKNI
ncbi:MAG: hypothetical protein IJW50_01470 [Clostridia bacterium]|nr:hypothetical protein [Clostridia bacterium]